MPATPHINQGGPPPHPSAVQQQSWGRLRARQAPPSTSTRARTSTHTRAIHTHTHTGHQSPTHLSCTPRRASACQRGGPWLPSSRPGGLPWQRQARHLFACEIAAPSRAQSCRAGGRAGEGGGGARRGKARAGSATRGEGGGEGEHGQARWWVARAGQSHGRHSWGRVSGLQHSRGLGTSCRGHGDATTVSGEGKSL